VANTTIVSAATGGIGFAETPRCHRIGAKGHYHCMTEECQYPTSKLGDARTRYLIALVIYREKIRAKGHHLSPDLAIAANGATAAA